MEQQITANTDEHYDRSRDRNVSRGKMFTYICKKQENPEFLFYAGPHNLFSEAYIGCLPRRVIHIAYRG